METLTPPPANVNRSDIIRQELIRLCISPKLLGFYYLADAIESVASDPMRIKQVTTHLYPDIAQAHSTTAYAVERSIRTAVKACWNRGGKERLSQIAGYRLIEPLWATEFIAVVAAYIARVYRQ